MEKITRLLSKASLPLSSIIRVLSGTLGIMNPPPTAQGMGSEGRCFIIKDWDTEMNKIERHEGLQIDIVMEGEIRRPRL
jgi:hypothetical protein